MMQASKSAIGSSEDSDLEAIAGYFQETPDPSYTYILGPGSTLERIAKRLGAKKTLLGIDAIKGNGTLLGRDMDETALLDWSARVLQGS